MYLLAVVVSALEVSVRMCVNICVLSTHVAVTCPTNSTLAHTRTHTENGKGGTI